ncbi:DMT family transporter [Commensalibacter oyaizuii]|uniref:EamA family transporter n=1 Tax=Commensalibacter oyaizuii TaxID=3043873 RepID=A0ABT6Q0I2_9PROT|nr:EamA family transporter [Commensalibacter sp. TBRC 16381]MDI2090483.1 EamA family transporter [Commensalibacter sp. TBRC 16381]
MNNRNHSKQYIYGIVCIIFSSFLWGTTGVAATFAPTVSAIAIGAAAMGFGGLLQAGFHSRIICKYKSALRKQWIYIVLGGLAVAIYPLAFYKSMNMAGVAIGNVVSIGSAPIITAFIEAILDRQKITLKWGTGAIFGCIGIALLSYPHHQQSGHIISQTNSTMFIGVVMGLIAGFTYAFYSWAARRLIQNNIPSQAAMGSIFGIGGTLLMPVLIATGGSFLTSWQNISVGIYMACIPMFLGYVGFGYGLKNVKASIATTITLLEPVVATLLAVTIVKEQLSPTGWMGITLIIICLIIITWPSRKLISCHSKNRLIS